MTVTIRDATAADEAAWRGLWTQYLAFYETELPTGATDVTWQRCMDPALSLTARLAVRDGTVLGFALHHLHISTWAVGMDCYLEDLFVAPEARGSGAGRALLDDLVALCRTKGWARLYWHTNAGNVVARGLYDSFTPTDGHVRYRMNLG